MSSSGDQHLLYILPLLITAYYFAYLLLVTKYRQENMSSAISLR